MEGTVTKDLIARGFGRDVMGLLLAYREQDLEKMFHPLKIKHVLYMIRKCDVVLPCSRCDKVMFGNVDEPKNGNVIECPWCKVVLCHSCGGGKIGYEMPCVDCKVYWCTECGSDTCQMAYGCHRCLSKICLNTTCSRCWISDTQHKCGNYKYFSELNGQERMHVKAVAMRLGIKDDDRIFDSN